MVSEDVAAAQASAWREQFAEFYDITLEDWIASGNDAMFASLNGLKFLGLVENGKITDAAINAAEAAEISGSTMWWYGDFDGLDLSDVKYWPSNVSTSFMGCTFGDSVPTSGDSEIYDCYFGSVLPVGRIYGGVIPEGAVAQAGTVFRQVPDTIANLTNPEVATCSYVNFNYDSPALTAEQIASFGSLSNCTLPDNIEITYAQATAFGILSGNNELGYNSYITADENCTNIHAQAHMFNGLTAAMLDASKTHVSDWDNYQIRSDQYSLIYPLIRDDVNARLAEDPWIGIYTSDGGYIGGSELQLY